jgi:pyridoxal phosphate enzyme (YggS family)
MGTDANSLETNVRAVRDRIGRACERAGRPRESVSLVAVTKNRSPGEVDALFAQGLVHVGENRVQEAVGKAEAVASPVTWHMIGHLQKNKANKALSLFSSLHSADAPALLRRIDGRLDAGPPGPPVPFPVYIQVNVSGEEAKSGITPESLDAFLTEAAGLPRIRVLGLMTMPPWTADPEEARPHFRRLAALAREAAERKLLPENPGLSMGMTNDFEVAIEEGATVIRVGSALFAP